MALLKEIPTNSDMEDIRDHESWKTWFQLHGPKLLLCARQWTRTRADAEDIVQDAFVRFWRHQRQLPGDAMALLVTSVRRAAIDGARRDTRRAVREDRALGGSEDRAAWFESHLEDDERRDAIEDAVRQLPPEQREVLVLKIWGELTFEQIASELELSPNTAASRYRYALSALRRRLTAADCHG